MSLFDIPHPAHLADSDRPVLWFGTEVVEGEIAILCANEQGRLVMFRLHQVIADVRHVTERDGLIVGQTGPGWIDLEDIGPKKVAEAIFANASEASVAPPADPPASSDVTAMIEGTDYITDKEGHWFDPDTGQELDKKTGKPIE